MSLLSIGSLKQYNMFAVTISTINMADANRERARSDIAITAGLRIFRAAVIA